MIKACTECDTPKGTIGSRCKTYRASRASRCGGTVYAVCGDARDYSTGWSRRLFGTSGFCTSELGHAGDCSWRRSGAPCRKCGGSGDGSDPRQRAGLTIEQYWYETVAHVLSRLKPSRCNTCGGTGKMP